MNELVIFSSTGFEVRVCTLTTHEQIDTAHHTPRDYSNTQTHTTQTQCSQGVSSEIGSLSSHLKCDVEAEEFLHPQMLLSVPLQLQKTKKREFGTA